MWKVAASGLLEERLSVVLSALRITLMNSPESQFSSINWDSQPSTVTFWGLPEVKQQAEELALLLTHLKNYQNHQNERDEETYYRLLVETCRIGEALLADPTLLPALYFPLEQRASIYAPYWAPVLAPVIKAAVALLK